MTTTRPALVAEPIVALDVPTLDDAQRLADRIGDACRFVKIGLELFTAAGPRAVERFRARGADVFLDLKFHDIPNTVRGAVRSAASLGARLVTVHASGGAEMLAAAVEGAGGPGASCGVLGVTILTSMTGDSAGSAWGRPRVNVREEVLRLAGTSAAAGCHGVVCSGEEVAAVRAEWPALSPLVPGVRFAGGDRQDQARVVTPGEAASRGARYVVVGRAVTAAADPRSAMARVIGELQAAATAD
ncbi:MAG: orotidine-5'-phosphate decarboxylase [Gemmatimonadaceae bacterium]